MPPPQPVAVVVSAPPQVAQQYTLPLDASFVMGSVWDDFKAVPATGISYGMKLIAPLSRKVNVLSRSETTFTGETYDVYTDHVNGDPFVTKLNRSGEPAFCVRCFSGSSLLRLFPSSKTYRYELVRVEEIRKNDVVVSMAALVPAAMRNAYTLKTERGEVPSLIVKVSQTIRRTVNRMPAMSITVDASHGVIVDGIALGRVK